MRAPIPTNEAERLKALRSYQVLDTASEVAFDDLAKLAATLCGTPIAAIGFIDSDRNWLKASHGVPVCEVPRDLSFCAHAILETGAMMVVRDATQDERFMDHPVVAREDGLRFYVGVPLVSPEGMAIGALCVADSVERDISEDQAKALQILARQIMTELELRRTHAQLVRQTEDLERAKVAAEAGNRSKATFLSNMSHEIRTPMNGIVGVAGLLNSTPLNETQRHYVATIQNSAESLLTLLTDVLDLATIDSGKMTVRRELIDLPPILQEVEAMVDPGVQLKGLEVRVRSSNVKSRPVGDPLKLKQVLLQLLDDSMHQTDQGVIEIDVTETDGKASFVVSDSRRRTRHRESDIRIMLSAGLIELMGGELTSGFARDGRFERSFELPAARPPTVLVVDDNSVNSMVLAAILERHGCRVHCAVGGREAVEAAAAERYDIVFMDLLMPEMDGFEAAKAIRGLGSDTARAPILAITSSPYEGAREDCLGAGMNDYLKKPVREPMILEALSKWDLRSVA